mmetsp:Transcript_39591/g.123341  ORF Transcript_39591/g.123341 Transcript_39591/m.123341 type:complete len:201 (+) Transcript_39591:591-1193(+)
MSRSCRARVLRKARTSSAGTCALNFFSRRRSHSLSCCSNSRHLRRVSAVARSTSSTRLRSVCNCSSRACCCTLPDFSWPCSLVTLAWATLKCSAVILATPYFFSTSRTSSCSFFRRPSASSKASATVWSRFSTSLFAVGALRSFSSICSRTASRAQTQGGGASSFAGAEPSAWRVSRALLKVVSCASAWLRARSRAFTAM